MRKLGSLRSHLESHFGALISEPERLSLHAVSGAIDSTLGDGIGIGWKYTARLILIDYTGDLREVSAAIVQWLAVNQPDVLQNAETRRRLTFDVELLSASTCDVQIDIPLMEAATFQARPGGGFVVTEREEPEIDTPYTDGAWDVSIDMQSGTP